ncbi:MAG: response regulator [Polyangiaceae bacterium]|nr:response regulator [Polyangiaceae bacterium]
MPLEPGEAYELFLTLAHVRLAAARAALQAPAPAERARAVRAALVPFAVDAALLGADGLSQLATAASVAGVAPGAVAEAVGALEGAAVALASGDASGARVDEHALRELAARLAPREREPPAPAAEALPGGVGDASDETTWTPAIAEDMVAAFLDECAERLDGLAERLLELEGRGADPELVASLFRDLHTLKGSSAFAGLRKMNRVAHLAEDLIGEVRAGKRAVERPLIDVLLETLDVLRAIVDRARAQAPIDVDVRDLLERLRDPARAAAGAHAPRAATEALPAPSGPAPAAAGAGAGGQATLRIDFEKVDLLLNLVGEVVLARGRLSGAAEVQGALLREVGQLRKRLGALAAAGTAPARDEGRGPVAEDLQRTERVLRETYADLDAGLASLGLAVGQLRDNVMKLRMVPISRLFTKYQRTVRDLAAKLGKEVRVELVGAETELDKVLVERLEDPLLHLVRNAVDHGIERPEARLAAGKAAAGTVRLAASQRGGQIVVTITDDGAGMDPAKLRAKAVEKGVLTPDEAADLDDARSFELIFRAGFSTAAVVSDVSGRGVGMDVVRDTITRLKGAIHIDSGPGRGSTLELRLPLTLAITQVLAARAGAELVAIPLDAVVAAQTVGPGELEPVAEGECLRFDDRLVPVVRLADALGLDDRGTIGESQEASVVIVDVGSDRLGLLVRQLLGRHEVVIKSLGPLLAGAECAAGATLIGDRVLLVVDLVAVAERARHPRAARERRAPARASRRARVLIAEDSDVVRETLRRELAAAGFEVEVAADGRAALALALERPFDAVSTDVVMPDMDGYELTRALRADPRHAAIPIVMLTSKDARIDALRGADAGADAWLRKPADAGELISTIDSLLARRRR